jgi:MoaA/NifB/PqqE/SkfB family radical SAM enzyme
MDPPRADLRLGYLCNHNCKFCCVSDERRFNISTKEALQRIKFAKNNGSEKIVFTGGEPTIRKDIFQLVKYASSLNFKHILIITNGQMTAYENFFEKLVDAGLTDITFSIPHINEKEFEYLTQVKGSFSRLMKSIELSKKYNLMTATISVITKKNYKYLPEMTEYLSNLSKNYKTFFSEFMFINPTNNAWHFRDALIPKIREVAPYVHKSLEIAKKKNFMLNIEAIPFCYMQGYEKNVVELHMAKDRVYLDQNKKADFEFNKNRRVQGKTKKKDCIGCDYDSICEGIWNGYAEIYGVEELNPKKTRENNF